MEVAVQTYWESTQQTAVVTGAAHPAGIGFGIAEALASCGMDVVIMDLPSTPLGESSAKLQENYGVRVLPVPIDITSDQDVEKAVEQIRRFTPTVHALVNNAGICLPVPVWERWTRGPGRKCWISISAARSK